MTGESVTITRDRLVADLRALGLRPGQNLLVHCSLRRIGRVAGGAATVLDAITQVAGSTATLVVPAETAWNSLSSRDFRRATAGLNPEGLTRYIAALPGFDPATTPSAGMGMFAEHVRTRAHAYRSAHPQSSFAAVGGPAEQAMSIHDLDCHLGERSPLGWLYRTDAAIVLLGVGYAACTAFHLAEYRQPGNLQQQVYHCFTASGAVQTHHVFTDIELVDGDFEQIGAALEAARWPAETAPRRGQIGLAPATLLPVRTAVDFAGGWLSRYPRSSKGNSRPKPYAAAPGWLR